eukprot:7197892-Pyramimonas_sp.AAC.1
MEDVLVVHVRGGDSAVGHQLGDGWRHRLGDVDVVEDVADLPFAGPHAVDELVDHFVEGSFEVDHDDSEVVWERFGSVE